MTSLSMAQLLILFDHILLAILFLIALFCVLVAVSASFSYSTAMRKKDVTVMRTDTCYTTSNGGAVLLGDQNWNNNMV